MTKVIAIPMAIGRSNLFKDCLPDPARLCHPCPNGSSRRTGGLQSSFQASLPAGRQASQRLFERFVISALCPKNLGSLSLREISKSIIFSKNFSFFSLLTFPCPYRRWKVIPNSNHHSPITPHYSLFTNLLLNH